MAQFLQAGTPPGDRFRWDRGCREKKRRKVESILAHDEERQEITNFQNSKEKTTWMLSLEFQSMSQN